jgi:hypothetical protein
MNQLYFALHYQWNWLQDTPCGKSEAHHQRNKSED